MRLISVVALLCILAMAVLAVMAPGGLASEPHECEVSAEEAEETQTMVLQHRQLLMQIVEHLQQSSRSQAYVGK